MDGLREKVTRLAGAERLVGVELDTKRYEASLKLAQLLQSQVMLRHCDFLDFDVDEGFDHVYILLTRR